jgi:hypothetical protein
MFRRKTESVDRHGDIEKENVLAGIFEIQDRNQLSVPEKGVVGKNITVDQASRKWLTQAEPQSFELFEKKLKVNRIIGRDAFHQSGGGFPTVRVLTPPPSAGRGWQLMEIAERTGNRPYAHLSR